MCYVLQKVTKEKNTLAERLKNAEASRKRFDDELKRYAAETQTREEIRKSLENEVRRLTQTVGQTEGEKKEREEQITRCEAYIDGMESKLQVCQVFTLLICYVSTAFHTYTYIVYFFFKCIVRNMAITFGFFVARCTSQWHHTILGTCP